MVQQALMSLMLHHDYDRATITTSAIFRNSSAKLESLRREKPSSLSEAAHENEGYTNPGQGHVVAMNRLNTQFQKTERST